MCKQLAKILKFKESKTINFFELNTIDKTYEFKFVINRIGLLVFK